MRKILRVIDYVNERVGSISSWLILILIAVILYEVIARYVFNRPTTWSFNTFCMISGALIVLGWAYVQRHDSHIRVDVIYLHLSLRKKAFIDVIGTGLFFFPLFGALTVIAGSVMWQTWLRFAPSISSHLSLPPTKLLYQITVVIGLCLFFLQFTARFIRDVYILIKGRPY